MLVTPREQFEMTMVRSRCRSEMDTDDRFEAEPHHLLRQIAARYEPTVEILNVVESTDVHVGPKFVSVSQNIERINVAKGRILGLELVSPQNSKRFRCSILVFVCWALVIACVLMFFVFYFAFSIQPTRLDLDIHEAWYITRPHWYANIHRGMQLLKLPISMVVIGHSVTDFCTEKYRCIQTVLNLQTEHIMEKRWEDIGPNFLVGGNGFVFEGRGANILSEMMPEFNHKIISIQFIGNYVKDMPTMVQFTNVNYLLRELVEKQVLTTDYILYGQCQIIGHTVPPGPNIIDRLHFFKHWNSDNATSCQRF